MTRKQLKKIIKSDLEDNHYILLSLVRNGQRRYSLFTDEEYQKHKDNLTDKDYIFSFEDVQDFWKDLKKTELDDYEIAELIPDFKKTDKEMNDYYGDDIEMKKELHSKRFLNEVKTMEKKRYGNDPDVNMNNGIVVLSTRIARNLLRKNYQIIDVKPNRTNRQRTVFVFLKERNIESEISNMSQKILA